MISLSSYEWMNAFILALRPDLVRPCRLQSINRPVTLSVSSVRVHCFIFTAYAR